MDVILIILVIIAIAGNIALVTVLLRRKRLGSEEDVEVKSLKSLVEQINLNMTELSKAVDSKIGDTNRIVNDTMRSQLSASQKFSTEVAAMAEKVTRFEETGKQVLTITDQLRNLEKVLTHQKQRGNLGEAGLELILSSVLSPTTYEMQYLFKNGDKVDAVIKTPEGLIPIDAKFSLENYRRVLAETDEKRRDDLKKEFRNDLKKRIDETSKYVRPEEGTLPFAFMFIPAEGLFYDLLVNDVGATKASERNLIDYAYNDRKVIIISPNTFAAYLQTVLYGFRAFKIEEKAKELQSGISRLIKHFEAYVMYHNKLGDTLSTAANHYRSSSKNLNLLQSDVLKVTGKTFEKEVLMLDKPEVE